MQHALHYLRMGFSVIPLRPRAKEPLIPWQEFQKRRATESVVRHWFRQWPTANLGIVTGSISGIAIVDLDGPEGLASGSALQLRSSVTSLTGKGKQLYYRHPGGNVCNAVRKLPGIDIRGDGGYVCAPPSVHPNGRRYQWIGSALNANALTPFPIEKFASPVGSKPTTLGTKEQGWVAKALEDMKHGNIDDTLFKVCSRLRSDGYSAADALLLLKHHALRAGAEAGHLEAKINNVWKRYLPNKTEPVAEANAESIGDFMAALTPVEWICRPLIAKETLVFVAGLPETNKTWLLMDLAVECARGGGKWLDLYTCAGTKVLFIDQERFKGETQRRFKAVMSQKGITAADLKDNLFIRCGTTTRLDQTPSYEAFRRELLEIKPGLVIVDSFATFHTTDENSRQGIQIVLERIKALRQEIGCTFIFIDHENKMVYADQENKQLPTYARMVGSIAKPAAAETVLTVRRFDADTALVFHTKSTLASTVPAFVVKVVDTDKGVRVYGEGEK